MGGPALHPTKPNLVIVLADDLGWGDVGCFGATAIATPQIDAIAARGVRFAQMLAAAPTGVASRRGLLTGRYPRQTGPAEPPPTIAGGLKPAGYASGCVGAWRLGAAPEQHPLRQGFDEFFGLPEGHDADPLRLFRDEEAVQTGPDPCLLTRRFTDEAIAFIERHADRPFFVLLAHAMPRAPLFVEEAFRGESDGGTYGDAVQCIDFHLGRLIERLGGLGLADDTLLIVTSDHGPADEGSTGGLRGRRGEAYEGGFRVPFVAQWPARIAAGTVCDEPASLLDLLPTLLSVAGVRSPGDVPLDGVSISAAFKGRPAPTREAFFYDAGGSINAVRAGKWKLHVARGPAGDDCREMPQLFDLDVDPGECYNLEDRYPDVVARLREMIDRFDSELR